MIKLKMEEKVENNQPKKPSHLRFAGINANTTETIRANELSSEERALLFDYLMLCTDYDTAIMPNKSLFNGDRLLYTIAKGMYDNMMVIHKNKEDANERKRISRASKYNEQSGNISNAAKTIVDDDFNSFFDN